MLLKFYVLFVVVSKFYVLLVCCFFLMWKIQEACVVYIFCIYLDKPKRSIFLQFSVFSP